MERMIRVVWYINGTPGHGQLQPLEKRKTLEAWRDYGNKKYGEGTHWVEEVNGPRSDIASK